MAVPCQNLRLGLQQHSLLEAGWPITNMSEGHEISAKGFGREAKESNNKSVYE